MKKCPYLIGGFLFAGSLAIAGAPAHADVITLHAAADTEIYAAGPTDRTKGDDQLLHIGSDASSSDRRLLIRFDLSSLPQNAQVTEATLSLRVAHVQDGNEDGYMRVDVHRLLKDWEEGGNSGSDYPARASSWDYNFYQPGGDSNSMWGAPGADDTTSSTPDRAANPTATFNAFSGLLRKPADVTADVQAMLDGSAENYGWILIAPDAYEDGDRFRFRSREDSDPSRGPQLAITYTIPEPGTAALGLSGVVFALMSIRPGRRSRL